jgi:peptide chain release factor 2
MYREIVARSIEELRAVAERVRSLLGWVVGGFDVDDARARLAELEVELGRPGLWDDPDHARQVSSQHGRLAKQIERVETLRQEVADLDELFEMAEEEEAFLADLDETLARLEAIVGELEEERLFSGEYDNGNALVSLHAGEGGTDAQDWTDMLLRMYLRWAERRRFDTNIVAVSEGEEAGLKSAELMVRGDHAYGLFSCERGVHRLVRLSPFDSAHRRQTSFAQVVVSPLVEDAVEVDIDEKEIRIDTYRSTGAGGQHVNKTDSAVRITHIPTGIVVQCQNERSQMQNRAVAMAMLKSRLLERAIEEREEELDRETGGPIRAGFGNQIRSYVIHPYQMVKDLRTSVETGNVQAVLDGDIDQFVRAELRRRAGGNGSAA